MIERIIAFIIAILTLLIYLLTGTVTNNNNIIIDKNISIDENNPYLTKPTDLAQARDLSDPKSKDILKNQYRILSFNIENEAVEYTPEKVVQIFKDSNADVAILNEAHEAENIDNIKPSTNVTSAFNKAGIYNIYAHNWAIVVSKHPMTQPFKNSTNKYLNSTAFIDGKYYVIPIHLTDYPYQPFQLAKIPYCYDDCQKNICDTDQCSNKTAEKKMIDEAALARGRELDLIIDAINTIRNKNNNVPIMIGGDFNEPSHLDWTKEAVTAGTQPLKVKFPTSSRLAEIGMKDLYRIIYPDPVKNPGFTWPAKPLSEEYLTDLSKGKLTKLTSTPTDRIDFIYGMGVTPLSAKIIDTPSDHNAVLIDVQIN